MLSKVSVIIVLSIVYYITPSDERNAVPIMQSDSGPVSSIYQQLAQLTGGKVYHSDKDNISSLAGVIKESVQSYVLMSSFSMDGRSSPYKALYVDKTISELKLDITEATNTVKPSASVVSPTGNQILLTTNYLGNGATEIFLQVSEDGKWWLHKEDSQHWQVSLYGKSGVDFTSTFLATDQKTGITLPMEGKPIVGMQSLLLVQVTEVDKISSVDGVVFVDENGTALSRFPLLPQGHRGTAFKTSSTIPNVNFRVCIEGRDQAGNMFVRAARSLSKLSTVKLTIKELKGDLTVSGVVAIDVMVTNLGERYDQVTVAISDDQGLVQTSSQTVYLWPKGSAIVTFQVLGGSRPGITTNVMIKATPGGVGGDGFQYIMRTLTVQAKA